MVLDVLNFKLATFFKCWPFPQLSSSLCSAWFGFYIWLLVNVSKLYKLRINVVILFEVRIAHYMYKFCLAVKLSFLWMNTSLKIVFVGAALCIRVAHRRHILSTVYVIFLQQRLLFKNYCIMTISDDKISIRACFVFLCSNIWHLSKITN